MMVTKVCALIPALNEEARIGRVIEGARKAGVEALVVDDGSTDNTATVAERAGAFVVRHRENRGKGAAIRAGFARILAKDYDAVVTLDADGQHDPAEIPLFIEALTKTGAGIVNGDRMHSLAGMPWIRVLCNRCASSIVSKLAEQHIPDALIGYRIIAIDALRATFPKLRADRYEIDPETILRASLAGYPVASMQVRCIYGSERSRIRPILDAHYFFRLTRALAREKVAGR